MQRAKAFFFVCGGVQGTGRALGWRCRPGGCLRSKSAVRLPTAATARRQLGAVLLPVEPIEGGQSVSDRTVQE